MILDGLQPVQPPCWCWQGLSCKTADDGNRTYCATGKLCQVLAASCRTSSATTAKSAA